MRISSIKVLNKQVIDDATKTSKSIDGLLESKRISLGSIVVLAGKGHEPYQEINGEKLPFDERVIVKELLEELKK